MIERAGKAHWLLIGKEGTMKQNNPKHRTNSTSSGRKVSLRKRWPGHRTAKEHLAAEALWITVRPKLVATTVIDADDEWPCEAFADYLVRQARTALEGERPADSVEEMVGFALNLQTLGARTKADILRRPRAGRRTAPAGNAAGPESLIGLIRPSPE